MLLRKTLAWCVHLYTALGLVAAAGIAVLIHQGDADSIRWAFVLMLIATLIDATDGTLARMIHIKEVLPGFYGRRLDDLVDFLTYSFLPLFLLWRADIPQGETWWLLVPLLASVYGFCQVSAKTADGYFLGFPSLWNVMAFYLYVLEPPSWLALALLFTLAFLTFVPSRYLYPTQRGRLNYLTNVLATIWSILLMWILVGTPFGDTGAGPLRDEWSRLFTLVSLVFPIYYLLASWAVTLRYWRMSRTGAVDGTLASGAPITLEPGPGTAQARADGSQTSRKKSYVITPDDP